MTQLVAGKMYRPTDVATDIVDDTVYVVEQFNHRVSKWDYTPGSFTFTLDTSWGNNGDGTTGQPGPVLSTTDNNLYRPTGIAFDATNDLLYLTDTFHNRVRVINPTTGAFTESVGQGGFGVTDFYHPAGIAINATHANVLIADELNIRAVSYITNGTTLITPTVSQAPTPLGFIRPHGVAFDLTNSTFNVTDSIRGLISKYDITGVTFSSQFGTPGTTGTDLFFPSSGHGILTGTTGTTFADTRNNILKTLDGTTIVNTTGTIAGTGNGQLYYPESVKSYVDTSNYVLAANTLNNRVEIFSNSGVALTNESPFNFGAP